MDNTVLSGVRDVRYLYISAADVLHELVTPPVAGG